MQWVHAARKCACTVGGRPMKRAGYRNRKSRNEKLRSQSWLHRAIWSFRRTEAPSRIEQKGSGVQKRKRKVNKKKSTLSLNLCRGFSANAWEGSRNFNAPLLSHHSFHSAPKRCRKNCCFFLFPSFFYSSSSRAKRTCCPKRSASNRRFLLSSLRPKGQSKYMDPHEALSIPLRTLGTQSAPGIEALNKAFSRRDRSMGFHHHC